MGYIEKIRQRPSGQKHAFSFVTALAITASIALVWGFVIFPHSIEVAGGERAEKAQVSRTKAPSPFASIKSNLASVFSNAGTELSEILSGIDLDSEYEKMRPIEGAVQTDTADVSASVSVQDDFDTAMDAGTEAEIEDDSVAESESEQ